MKTQELFAELYILFKDEKHNGAFVQFPPRTRRIMELLRELNDVFDLPLWKLEEILVKFVGHSGLTDEIVDETLIKLAVTAALHRMQSKLEEKKDDDGSQSEERSHSHKIQCEEIDLDDDDDEILNRALDKGRERLKGKEFQTNKPVRNVINYPPVIANRKCYEFVKSHIYLPLDEREFCNIETGFRLLWNHAGRANAW